MNENLMNENHKLNFRKKKKKEEKRKKEKKKERRKKEKKKKNFKSQISNIKNQILNSNCDCVVD